jgi:hypothetical protein
MTLAAIRHHHLFPRFVVIAGSACALALGLLTVGSVFSTTSDARTASTPTFSTFERVAEGPATLACRPPSLTQAASSFSERATGAQDITLNSPVGERSQRRARIEALALRLF